MVYVGPDQTFSFRTSLISGGEGTVLGPSIDESDALITKPGTGGAAVTLVLSRHPRRTRVFPPRQARLHMHTCAVTVTVPDTLVHLR